MKLPEKIPTRYIQLAVSTVLVCAFVWFIIQFYEHGYGWFDATGVMVSGLLLMVASLAWAYIDN